MKHELNSTERLRARIEVLEYIEKLEVGKLIMWA